MVKTKSAPAVTRFQKLKDGWVRDNHSRLEWGPAAPDSMNFKDAQKYCKEQGGRLPEIRELHSLVDYTKCDPAIDKDFFPDTKSSWYWTATPVAGYSGSAWCVGFYYGYVFVVDKGYDFYVRPVRSSQ